MTTDAVGGVWTYALDVAEGLSQRGVRTTLVVFGPRPSDDQRRDASRIVDLDLIETNLPLEWTAQEMAEIEESAAALRGLVRAHGADLVHLNSPALASGGELPAPVLGVCHSCMATWWSAVKEGPMPPDFSWRARAIWLGMLNCAALVAPTRAFAEATAKTYEVSVPFVVPNGRSAPVPAPRKPRRNAVFTSGRLWDEGKNVRVLDAAAKLASVPLRAAGPLLDPTGDEVADFPNLQLLGRLTLDQVRAELAQARIYASGARYEPFGLGVLEAAQAGCALVLSDIPTFRELWNDVAEFVPAQDPEAYAAALTRLLADESRASRLGEAARRRAALYTPEAMMAGLIDPYRQLGLTNLGAHGQERAA